MENKPKQRIGLVQVFILVFVWALLFASPLVFGNNDNGFNWPRIFRIWQSQGIIFAVFLLNRLFYLPRLFFRDRRGWYFLFVSVTIVAFTSLVLLQTRDRLPDRRHPLPPEVREQMREQMREERLREERPGDDRRLENPAGNDLSRKRRDEVRRYLPPDRWRQREFIRPFGNLLLTTILLIGFDTGLAISVKWIRAERSKLELEKELVENKMAFLQTQISPHFFMNTLNNIHALVDIDTGEAKEAIIKLSRLMDYMLYESQTPLVDLKRELDFLANYVELMRLRYPAEVDIRLDLPGTVPERKIPPILTISFVENAFQHGISYEAPSFVHIGIGLEEDRFRFRLRNSIHPDRPRRAHSGIGMENTRHRLDLLYGKAYDLVVQTDDGVYDLNLNIPL
ncbi:MAG: histidine kinase [Bacteroidales bacterium]